MPLGTIVLIIVGVVLIAAFVVLLSFINLYMQCLLSNARLPLMDIIRMRLSGIDVRMIALSRVGAKKGGVHVTTEELLDHHRRGGSVVRVVSALITARSQGIDVPWNEAAAAELAGFDPLDVGQTGKPLFPPPVTSVP